MLTSKEFKILHSTVSGIITKAPVLLSMLIYTAKGEAQGFLNLYNGLNTGAERLFIFTVSGSTSNSVNFSPLIYFPRGGYIYMSSDISSYSVHYKELII